ncbi:hypothetical protein G4D59_12655 [Bacillus altitudinis]|uniref:hypothetical protein n=1 Tax=Bacillus altitudinis TaxID=293387 RepID=UPI0002EFAB96|nr:hypothetical protein [Bacillus altitudinis]QKL22527.1 hypothetical protein RI02_12780 [Bacillus altitudinis]QKL26260.1 hypothetical protein EQK04_12780 [Bacillus altitudinis]QXY96643.1 hypothetical protein G4D59_12655 [Bacillus altitudinis]
MKPIYKYDDQKIYVLGADEKISEDEVIPAGFTDVQPQEGLFLPKYNEDKRTWSEAATQEYIDSLQPDSSSADDVTMLKKQVAMLTLQVAQLQRGGSS